MFDFNVNGYRNWFARLRDRYEGRFWLVSGVASIDVVITAGFDLNLALRIGIYPAKREQNHRQEATDAVHSFRLNPGKST